MNWMRFRKLYFVLSASMIIFGAYALVKWGLNLGVDFKGGSIIEYKFEQTISTEDATSKLAESGIEVTSIQSTGELTYLFKLPPINKEEKEKITTTLQEEEGDKSVEELRFETVGPSIGPDLVRRTLNAIVIAAALIMIWVAYQFKSFKYGVSAILAMFHDSFILLGSFAILGHFLDVEVDFLFVTALLTTLSFSVHDTIVVYDRIRESQKKYGTEVGELANKAVSETMVRSLNNSFTIIFMLLALVLMGGTTVKWFAVALLIGTVLGTYSSPFVAVPLLVTWDEIEKKVKK
jgi:preprotein translocase subunit SecF